MGVEIKYKGNQIASMAESGTKTLKTGGAYCEGDITVEYEKPMVNDIVSGTKDITVNGEHDVAAYAVAKVNVPIPSGYIKPSGTKNITENGTHDVTNYASTTVNVPQGVAVSGTKNITTNGEHDVSTYAKANVNVPIPSGYIKPTGTKTVTENGTHDVTSYSSVEVNVQGVGGSSNGKIIVLNIPSTIATRGWHAILTGDSDLIAHKDDPTLCITMHSMSTLVSGGVGVPFTMRAASPLTVDGKSSFYLYQASSNTAAVSSTKYLLRTKQDTSSSNDRGGLYVNDSGALEYFAETTYKLLAGTYIVTVSW